MSTLHVRNVPDDLYAALRERAEERGTSISSEAIGLLKRALRTDARNLVEVLDEIDEHRPRAGPAGISAAELIREDRDR